MKEEQEEFFEHIRVSKKTLHLMRQAADLLGSPAGPAIDVGGGWYEIPLTEELVRIFEKKEDFESHDQYLGHLMNVLIKRLKSIQ